MGSTKENIAHICDGCHNIWRDVFIERLDKMSLNWKKRDFVWHVFYAEFLSEGNKKEKVLFT
jgi:hypothetical protein